MKWFYWLPLATAVGLAFYKMPSPHSSVSDQEIERVAFEGYKQGILQPGELAVWVAQRVYPGETWPPYFNSPAEAEERYAHLYNVVSSFLARVR